MSDDRRRRLGQNVYVKPGVRVDPRGDRQTRSLERILAVRSFGIGEVRAAIETAHAIASATVVTGASNRHHLVQR